MNKTSIYAFILLTSLVAFLVANQYVMVDNSNFQLYELFEEYPTPTEEEKHVPSLKLKMYHNIYTYILPVPIQSYLAKGIFIFQSGKRIFYKEVPIQPPEHLA